MMKYIGKMIAILLGSTIFAIGIDFFLVPFRTLDGGIIGLALIINYLTGLKVGLTFVIFSIPVYIYVWYHYRSFFYNSVVGLLVSSLVIDFLFPYQFYFVHYVKLTPLVSSIIGGAFVGLGIGFMLRNNTSISGADMLAQILSNGLHINVGVMIFLLDAIVISLGGFLISLNTFYYSIITIIAVGFATSVVTLNHKFCEDC